MHALAQVSPSLALIAAISLVLFVSGFVSGLSGFAFSAMAAALYWVLPPMKAVPVILILSTFNQLVSAGSLYHHMRLDPRGGAESALPYILGGLIGVPLGIALLEHLPAQTLAAILGAFLAAYAVFSLLRPHNLRIAITGWRPALLAGAAGGTVGGFSGFPGSFPILYLNLRGLPRADMRGIVQPYIIAMQFLALLLLGLTRPHVFTWHFALLAAIGLPATLAGTGVGVAAFHALSEANFRQTVLLLLLLSGLSLVIKSLLG
jgi:uncharacterized protein